MLCAAVKPPETGAPVATLLAAGQAAPRRTHSVSAAISVRRQFAGRRHLDLAIVMDGAQQGAFSTSPATTTAPEARAFCQSLRRIQPQSSGLLLLAVAGGTLLEQDRAHLRFEKGVVSAASAPACRPSARPQVTAAGVPPAHRQATAASLPFACRRQARQQGDQTDQRRSRDRRRPQRRHFPGVTSSSRRRGSHGQKRAGKQIVLEPDPVTDVLTMSGDALPPCVLNRLSGKVSRNHALL